MELIHFERRPNARYQRGLSLHPRLKCDKIVAGGVQCPATGFLRAFASWRALKGSIENNPIDQALFNTFRITAIVIIACAAGVRLIYTPTWLMCILMSNIRYG